MAFRFGMQNRCLGEACGCRAAVRGGRNRGRTAAPAAEKRAAGHYLCRSGQKRLTAMKTTEADCVGILPVTSFRGVQPTGIAICERGRMCVWFPRWRDGVFCPVAEIFGDGFSGWALCAGYEKSFETGTAGRTPLPFTAAASVLPTLHSRGGGAGWRFP